MLLHVSKCFIDAQRDVFSVYEEKGKIISDSIMLEKETVSLIFD